ncbi:MAG: hypothetical protein JWM96_185 [Alphaproteobacteria bacterium]|nr:hypothetical protein [Alphaproteobacteria bacterium]
MLKNWLHFYTSFKGRASRYDFNVRTTLVLLVGTMIASAVDGFILGEDNRLCSDIWSYIALALTLAVTARRLHDLNLSGWWQLPVQLFTLGAMIGLDRTDTKMETVGDLLPLVERMDEIGNTAILGVLFAVLLCVIFFILLSARHGTKGPNKYGPDPLPPAIIDQT